MHQHTKRKEFILLKFKRKDRYEASKIIEKLIQLNAHEIMLKHAEYFPESV